MVGQAGAGSSRALRGKDTSTTASYEWATRAASASLPCQAATKVTESSSRMAGYEAGTAGSITVTRLLCAVKRWQGGVVVKESKQSVAGLFG
jgi:hypothetical protein